MLIASRVSKTRDSIRTWVLKTRVKCFLLILVGQNYQVESRGYRVYKTWDMLKFNTNTLSMAYYKPEKFKHTVTHTLSLCPLKLTHSHSLTHSFINQICGPNMGSLLNPNFLLPHLNLLFVRLSHPLSPELNNLTLRGEGSPRTRR